MNKESVYQFLREQDIPFETTEHKAVFNMEELTSVELPYPEWDAKNLFVRDDKKRNYYTECDRCKRKTAVRATSACAVQLAVQFLLELLSTHPKG